MSLNEEVELLRNIPMFAKLEPSKLKLLAFTSERITYEAEQLFFRQGDQFLAVTVTTEPELEISVPVVLFDRPFDRHWAGSSPYYDVSPDGRFVVVSERSTKQFKVIQNWFSELEQPVPTGN